MSEQRAVPEITPERAAEAVQRLINSHFRSGDRARTRVPASMDDDDLVASSFVSQSAQRIATLTAEVERLNAEVLRERTIADCCRRDASRVGDELAALRAAQPSEQKEGSE